MRVIKPQAASKQRLGLFTIVQIVGVNASKYYSPYGVTEYDTRAECEAQMPAGKIGNLKAHVTLNSCLADAGLRVYVNGVVRQLITVPAGETGDFTSPSLDFTLADGDLVAFRCSIAVGGSIRFTWSVDFEFA